MKPIVAIRYRDTTYLTSKKIKKLVQPTFLAMGYLTTLKNHVIISFTEEGNVSIRGLLIPNEALILKKEKKPNKFVVPDSLSKNNCDIGIFWQDIVYFENGKIPNKLSQMYTEGQFFSQTLESVIIKNPETITIKKDRINNHPKIKPTYFFIPKALITGIEFYERK